ncbi:MAG: hypothetical protein WDZ54_03265 [Sneathiella sp.]
MVSFPSSQENAIGILLVIIHVGLGLWAIVGFIEFFASQVPWPPLSNPLFPPAILLLQWTLILTAALVFVPGYLMQWQLLPWAMVFVYAAMAALCAVETFGFLQNDSRFIAMAAEYIAYLAIIFFLFLTATERG